MDTAGPTPRLASGTLLSRSEWPLAISCAIVCVAATFALAAGHVAGAGAPALGAAVFLLVALWCLTERRTERTLVVFALYVGMLDGYLKLRTGSREITLARDVLLWAIAAGALWRASQRGESLRLPPLGLFVVAFVLVVVAEVFNPSSLGPVQSLAGVRQHLEFVPLFFLGYAFVRTPRSLRALLVVLVLVASANGVVSYAQSTLSPAQLAGWGAGYSERILGTGKFAGQSKVEYVRVRGIVRSTAVRPFGLGSELGAGALTAVIALPGLIAMIFSYVSRLRLLAMVCAPAVVLGVVTAGSRGAFIACFAAVLAYAFLGGASRNVIRVAIGVAIGLAVILGTSSQLAASNDAAQRAQSVLSPSVLQTFWRERGDSVGLIGRYVADYPLGLGVGTVGPAQQALNPTGLPLDSETQWNLIVIEAGVAGLLLLVFFGASLVFLSAVRIPRFSDPEIRLQLSAVAAPLIALFVLCFVGPVSVSAPSGPYLWFAAGVLSYWLLGSGSRPSRAISSSS